MHVMSLLRAVVVLAAIGLVVGFAHAADAPPQRDPFQVPPALYNERPAVDPAKPQPAATPGELKSYSTLHSLGFEWDLGGGDTNHNATCAVQYRRADETSWHEALPLFRVMYAGWYQD